MGAVCGKPSRADAVGDAASDATSPGSSGLPAIETVGPAEAPRARSVADASSSAPPPTTPRTPGGTPTGRFQSVPSWNRSRETLAAGPGARGGGASGEISARDEPTSAGPSSSSSSSADPAGASDRPPSLPPMTHAHVVIVSCEGLRGADWTSYSDPFVEVGAFGARRSRRYRTPAETQTLNPTFDAAECRFLVPLPNASAEDDARGGLAFSVFDRDWGRSSDFLGGALVPASQIPRWGAWTELRLPLLRALPAGACPDAKRPGKHAVPEGAPEDLGVLTVRVAAADDAWEDEAALSRASSRPLTLPPSRRLERAKLREGKAGAEVLASSARPRGVRARRVHVCVLAGKHLAAMDANGLSDAFVRVGLDSSVRSERKRTETMKRTLDPVWGRGAGETFTFERRAGASEVQLHAYDADLTAESYMGLATVPLKLLPEDGSWSENMVVPLFPEGPSLAAKDAGQSMGFLVVRCAGASPTPRLRSAPSPAGPGSSSSHAEEWTVFPDVPNPPPPPPGTYINKVQSSTFLYFQVCGARDLPSRREGERANVQATIALNSDRKVHATSVQEDVLADSVWIPEVFSFPRNPNSSHVTVRVYGGLKKMWDPDVISSVAKDVSMGVIDVGGGEDDERDAGEGKDKGSAARKGGSGPSGGGDPLRASNFANAAVTGLRKKQFAMGVLIGEVKVPVADFALGADIEPRWLPVAPPPAKGGASRGLFGTPRWLKDRGDQLGEVCVAVSAGYLRQPPEDLIDPGEHAIRPTLGTLEVRLLRVEGDQDALNAAKGDPAGWFTKRLRARPEDCLDNPDGSGSGSGSVDLLGTKISAQLLFEGRVEKVASPNEHRAFEVTEPAAELRVLFFCEGPLSMDEVFVGAAMLPVSALLDAPNGEIDAWLETVGPNREASEAEMQDAGFRMRVTRAKTRKGWEGRCRVRAKLTTRQPMYRWYLRQPALAPGDPHVDDTIRGVVRSAERVVTAALAPATAAIACLAHLQGEEDARLRAAWVFWHTALCLLAKKHVFGAFLPLWIAASWCFVGYVAARARALDAPPALYHGKRVARPITAKGADGGEESFPSFRRDASKETRNNGSGSGSGSGRGKKKKTARDIEEEEEEEEDMGALSELIRAKEKEKTKEAAERASRAAGKEAAAARGEGEIEPAADDPPEPSGSAKPFGGELEGMTVAAYERESRMELCRLRVQRWLKELRIRRKKVMLDLQREEREEALKARGKSPKSAVELMRKAEGGGKRKGRGGGGGGLFGKKRRPAARGVVEDDGVDDDDPMQILLKRLRLRKIAAILASANPAEVILRILQQVTWTLLVFLKSTGSTLVSVTMSVGRVHKVLAGPCRGACAALDPVAESLEKLGGLLSWRDPRVSAHVAAVLLASALALSLALRCVVLPAWYLLDRFSPLRAWHVAWLVGVLPCYGRGAPRDACLGVVVAVERALQNLLGSVQIAPCSLRSIEALEAALEREFADAGGTWDGVEAAMREKEVEKAEKEARALKAASGKLAEELKNGAGLNPARWLTHALARAPTRLDHEHRVRVAQLVENVQRATNRESGGPAEGPDSGAL